MGEHNNALAGKLPKTPNPALKQFDRLIGTWSIRSIHGPDVKGTIRFEWMEGGFFLIQHFDLVQDGEHHKGIEYTGFDQDTGTLRSRLMEIGGARFMYTYSFEGNTMYYWFGEKGSNNHSVRTFSEDGNKITGDWEWPNPDGTTGGYSYTLERQ